MTPPETARVCDLILDYLKAEGVGAVFGIPGGPITPMFDALRGDARLRTIAARHEAGAAFMACGYARMTGGPGVCVLTTGPGATNALTGACAAKADGLPLVLLTAQAATIDFGKGALQDSTYDGIDTVAMFRPAVKLSLMPAHAGRVAAALRQAVRAAMTGRRGPVHVSLPTDLMKQQVARELIAPARYRSSAKTFDRAAVQEACLALLASRRPALFAGHGVDLAGAREELRQLAELLAAPVATTPKGKGAFDERSPLALGVFGLASSPRAEEYLLSGRVDALLVLGSSLHEMSTQGWDPRLQPKGPLIQADIEPATIGRNYPVDIPLVGDLKTTLVEMLHCLRRLRAQGSFPPRPAVETLGPMRAPADLGGAGGPVKPQRVIAELSKALPEDAVVCLDVGNHTLWALHYLEATGKSVFLNNWGSFAAMGYGVAGAIGAKLGAPGRPVVAVVGDGGFGMAGMEVSTAATYGIPVVWVVFNDARYNAVYHGQKLQYAGRTHGVEFRAMDVAAIAASLGARAFRVERADELQGALAAALACAGPAVVDVRIDAEEVPPILSRVRSLEVSFAAK